MVYEGNWLEEIIILLILLVGCIFVDDIYKLYVLLDCILCIVYNLYYNVYFKINLL